MSPTKLNIVFTAPPINPVIIGTGIFPFGSTYINGFCFTYTYLFKLNGSSNSPLYVSSDIKLAITGL